MASRDAQNSESTYGQADKRLGHGFLGIAVAEYLLRTLRRLRLTSRKSHYFRPGVLVGLNMSLKNLLKIEFCHCC